MQFLDHVRSRLRVASQNKLEARNARDRSTADLAAEVGYRSALAKVQAEAGELQRLYEGFQAAYRNSCADLARVTDHRDRIIAALNARGQVNPALPPALHGRQFCFLHIGKTAGTSLHHAILEAMPGATVLHESLPGFDAVTPGEAALYDLVLGHFMFQHVRKMRRERFLMTFLRDPVDRVVSNYHFLKTKSPFSQYAEGALKAAQQLSFKDFLLDQNPHVRMVTQNLQAKVLAHDVRPEHTSNPKTLLEDAERNLAGFDFVGIVEHFDDSVSALSSKLGLAAPLAAKTLNINADRLSGPAPTPEEIEIVRRLNDVDIALYTKARARFEENYL